MPKYICTKDRVFTKGVLYKKGDIANFPKGFISKGSKKFMLFEEHEKEMAARANKLKSIYADGKTDQDLINENQHLSQQLAEAKKKLEELAVKNEPSKKTNSSKKNEESDELEL